MKKMILRLTWTVLSGILLGLSWISTSLVFPAKSPAFLLIFVAFVPFLWVLHDLGKTPERKNGKRFFGYAFLCFLIWNVMATYWVFNSTPAAILAFLTNSVLMALMVYLYYLVKKRVLKNRDCLWVLAVFFTAFEYFHFDWDLSWPWLTLGNVFADAPNFVQFYEFTGVLGGSVWIWLVNIACFEILRICIEKKIHPFRISWKKAWELPVFLALPMGISFAMYHFYEEKGEEVEVVVVQPNIDPYHEQYDLSPLVSTQRMLQLAQRKITPDTRLILTPESMIQEYVWEHEIEQSPSLQAIQMFLSQYDSLELIAGLSSFSLVSERTAAARPYGNQLYYEAHNTALLVSKDDYSQKYYKSKLTPGVEIMPFVKYFKPLEKLALDMGGTVGTLGISENREVFHSQYGTPSFSPVICYESIYGDFVTGFVRNGAKFLCIITNDGWWGNTPGHRQHARYARLRAIETRRDIARCANTGISCFVNQRGEISQPTPYWKEAAIVQKINANEQITFYVKYGDIIGRISLFLAGILTLLMISLRIRSFLQSSKRL